MIRGSALIIVALVALPALMACQAPSETAVSEPSVSEPAHEQTISVQGDRRETLNAAPNAARKPAQPPPQVPPETSYPDIDTLQGGFSAQVTSLLGEPDFRRTDKPAQLWQYRHEACSVDVFLYPADSGALTVDNLEVRTFGKEPLSRQACFVAILKSRSSRVQG